MMTDKQHLRTQLINTRSSFPAREKSQASTAIDHALLNFIKPIEDQAPLLCYASTDMEVDTHHIFTHATRRLFAPVTQAAYEMIWREIGHETIWETGLFHIREPASGIVWTSDLGDAILVCPVVGFDRCGHRLGYGKGYFDRWISHFSPCLVTIIGLAFSCQEVDAIPAEKHDIPLDIIITEHEVITCQKP